MKKLIGVILALSLCFSLSALDLSDIDDVKNVLDGYAQGIVDAVPVEVSADNLWADAHIGQLLAIPPHVALGVNFGGAFAKNESLLSSLTDLTGINMISKLPGAPVPAASINGRIGGIILPFDIGFHGLFANLDSSDPINGSISVKSWGADFRYCILDQMIIVPAVSLGIGYDVVDVTANMTTGKGAVAFDFATKAKLLSGTAQVSWKLLFIKLFGGARVVKPLGDGIVASANVSAVSRTIPFEYKNDELSLQLFGGLGLRLLILDTTFGVTYDIKKGIAGGSISLRAQL